MPEENLRLDRGIHELTLKEIEKIYCFNPHRRTLFRNLKKVIKNLRSAGVKEIYIDGSFVDNKELPSDIDGCWLYIPSVITKKIDPVLLDFSNGRKKNER